MAWFVGDTEDDPDQKFYEDYETTDALADFFKRVSESETAILRWSY